MALPVLPRAQAPIAGPAPPAGTWYDFFRQLRQFVADNEGTPEQLAALDARITALEQAEDATRIVGRDSVRVFGSGDLIQIVLDGDEAQPGNTYFYGTGPDGVKGFFTVASAFTAEDFVLMRTGDDGVSRLTGLNPYADYVHDPDGDYVTDPDGNLLQADDGYPISLEYGGTGGDYRSVAANLLWASPDGLAGAPVFRSLVLADLPAGTTAQFLRGDRTWSDTLTSSMNVVLDGAGVGYVITRYSGDAVAPQYRSQKARGTLAVPAAVTTNDLLLTFQARGYHSGGAFSGNVGDIGITVLEPFTSSAQGTGVILRTAAIGGTTVATRFQVDATQASPGTTNASTSGSASLRWAATYTRDLVVGSATASLGGGVGVAFVSNATTAPTSTPTGGGLLYAEGGAGKWRGTSGTVTTFGPADPHCPVCGSDFVHEWDNPQKYGYLAVCMNCHCDGINSHTRVRGAWSKA